jgi:DNA repair exonuclease SbcCD ATPase subunit
MLERLTKTMQQLDDLGESLTVAAVARRARVSRTFLYQNEDARRMLSDFRVKVAQSGALAAERNASRKEANWRERALNAEECLSEARGEIKRQRNTIGSLLGRIEELESALPEESAKRLLGENTSLVLQIRELREDLRKAEERLAAARGNNRSLDERIAELELMVVAREGAHGSGQRS